MNLYTFCFPDYPTARAAAEALGFWDTEADTLRIQGTGENPDGSVFGWFIDEIGAVVETEAVTDAEGNVVTPAVMAPGYWVNMTGELPEGSEPMLAAYLRPYGSGKRLFAGSVAGPHPIAPPTPGTIVGEQQEHNGAMWEWRQARWLDGTFRADDPETPADEAFEWVMLP